MPEIKKQDYLKRDFETIRKDIEGVLKNYFPNEWQDFNVASAGMALIDLLAYVSDLLSYYTDKRFNELFLDGVSEQSSAYRLAKTLGYKVPGVKGSSTLIDVSIRVPAISTGPDPQYLPVYRPGMRLQGLGQTFETFNQIDFSIDYSDSGVANRIIDPIFDASQNILAYRITKREFCVAGETVTFKKVLNDSDANTDFLEVILPDNNVLDVLDVIVIPGSNITVPPTYTDYKNFDYKYYEVDHLADSQVFLEDTGTSTESFATGRWVTVNRRFTKEFMSDGTCKLTFGSGTPNVDAYAEYLNNLAITNAGDINYKKVFDNTSLGEKLPSDSTLFIKYRVGGGESSNVGTQVLNNITNIDAVIQGTNASTNDEVLSSTQATNIVPALGGRGLPNSQEIRYAASSNFAAQERCVTISDYISRAKQMPGRFGAPFRLNGRVNDNKIQLYILSKDANGKLTQNASSLVKNNMVEYLSRYRMINDFVEINNAKVVNLSFEIDLFTDKSFNGNEIRLTALQQMKEFFNVDNWDMNQHIYIAQLTDVLREIPGVINVIDIRAYNMDGGPYSTTVLSQATGPTEFINKANLDLNNTANSSGTRRTLIEYIDNAIFSTPLSMFEVRYPERDIKVRTS
jgi:hypothetical protein